MPGRWTQFTEDSYRLPEGVTRVGYDADTSQYTFRDRQGKFYVGEPGAEYGTLRPLSGAPRDPKNKENKALSVTTSGPPAKTFQDILPPNLITSPSESLEASHARSEISPRSRFVASVRKAALPKMQGVVHDLRRSVTTARRGPPASGRSDEKRTSLRRHASQDSMATLVGRSGSVSSKRSDASTVKAVARRSFDMSTRLRME
ncbi:hypothetical protein BD779DRAFT_1555567 [Infundibulicybe gibba]|nr:hypothetical protein BD779DRAFT_1555567 [Infundibulicybe gibba]